MYYINTPIHEVERLKKALKTIEQQLNKEFKEHLVFIMVSSAYEKGKKEYQILKQKTYN